MLEIAGRIDEGVGSKACLYLSGIGVVLPQPPPLAIDAGDWRLWLLLALVLLMPAAHANRQPR